jgi:hypothetical protein
MYVLATAIVGIVDDGLWAAIFVIILSVAWPPRYMHSVFRIEYTTWSDTPSETQTDNLKRLQHHTTHKINTTRVHYFVTKEGL